jgi:hypothetical protein
MGSAALLTALVGYVLFGFYVAAFGFMAIRIGSDMIGLFLAKRAEQNSHDLAQSENLKKLSLKDLPDILRRATTMASQFFAPATAMLVSSDGNVFIRIWAMQVFILALCSRPFRSIFVDAYHLVQKKLWRLLYYRLYMSAAIAGLLLVTTSAAFFLLGLSLDNSSWVWAAWVFCATCNGLYLNYLQTMAQDTKVFWQYATLRLLAATSILGAGFFIADSNAIPIACVFEGVLLLFVLRHATTFHGVQSLRCEVANTKPADQDSVAISPFRKFLLGKQVLDENQVPHRTLILTLTKSYKSSRNMTLLIEDIKLNLRSHDTVMAINARKIKVWCAGTSDTKPIYQRLIQAFPLEIEAINEISEAEQPPAKTGNIATLLDRKTVFKNTPIAQLGTWWVLDHTGHWVTETEQGLTAASAALNFELCKIYTKLESLVFLEQNRKHTIGDHSVYAFRPFGFTQGFLQISNQEFSAAHIVKSKTDVAGCFKNATESYRLNHNIRIDLTQTVSIESWSYIEMLMTSLVSAKKVTGSVSRAKHKRRDGEALDKCTKNILAISTNGQSPIELYIQPNTKEAI